MITMLMDAYKLECGENLFNFEQVEITQIQQAMLDLYKTGLKEKNIKLVLNSFHKSICTDKKYIIKIFDLLFNTVVDYAKANSTININITNKNNLIYFNIEYLGKRLSEEEKNRLFYKKTNFSTVGHGIQMYLCRQIIKALGGTISFQSINKTNNLSFSLCNNVEKHRLPRLSYINTNSLRNILPRLGLYKF